MIIENIFIILFFSFLYTITPILLNQACKQFNLKLNHEQKIDWVNRFVSTINAVVTTVLSIYVISNSEKWVEHPFYSTSATTYFTFRFISFYFIFDSIHIFFYKKILFNWGIFFHHTLGLLTFVLLGLINHESHYLVTFYSLSEITTPSVNLRKHLYDLELTDHIVYTINGCLMGIGFVFIRIFYVTYSIWEMFQRGYDIPLLTQGFYYTLFPCITLLNSYWTFLILKGIFKVLFIKPSLKKNKNGNENKNNKSLKTM